MAPVPFRFEDWPRKCIRLDMKNLLSRISIVFAFLGTFGFPNCFAQEGNRHQIVIGQTYTARSLVCTSAPARDDLLRTYRQGLSGPMPNGCEIRQISFIPQARVSGSQAVRTTATGRAPGEFMSVQLLNENPNRGFVFYYTDAVRLVTADGREPQAIQASFGSGAALNSNSGASGGLWGPDGGPRGAESYLPGGATNAVERREIPAEPVDAELAI
jgi:hypothetical protein